jgi:hypothetical protein
MATSDINEWYSVTVFPEEKVGPKRWRARAHVFRLDRLDTPENRVGEEFVGFGTTPNSARYDAHCQAKSFVESQGKPLDWQGR